MDAEQGGVVARDQGLTALDLQHELLVNFECRVVHLDEDLASQQQDRGRCLHRDVDAEFEGLTGLDVEGLHRPVDPTLDLQGCARLEASPADPGASVSRDQCDAGDRCGEVPRERDRVAFDGESVTELELLAAGIHRPPEAQLVALSLQSFGQVIRARCQARRAGGQGGSQQRGLDATLVFGDVDHLRSGVQELMGFADLDSLATPVDAQGHLADAEVRGVAGGGSHLDVDLERGRAGLEAAARAERDAGGSGADQIGRRRVRVDALEKEAALRVRRRVGETRLGLGRQRVEHDIDTGFAGADHAPRDGSVARGHPRPFRRRLAAGLGAGRGCERAQHDRDPCRSEFHAASE